MPNNDDLNIVCLQHLKLLLDKNSDVLRSLRQDVKMTEDRIKSIKQEMDKRSNAKQMELAL
jgi:hypothetical protein